MGYGWCRSPFFFRPLSKWRLESSGRCVSMRARMFFSTSQSLAPAIFHNPKLKIILKHTITILLQNLCFNVQGLNRGPADWESVFQLFELKDMTHVRKSRAYLIFNPNKIIFFATLWGDKERHQCPLKLLWCIHRKEKKMIALRFSIS